MGKQKNDMLHGSIWRGLPRFALPIAATTILGQLFNASDIAVVGNFAAQNRTAASIVGIDVNRNMAITIAISTVICCCIGILVVPLYNVSSTMSNMIGLKGFAAGVLGGFGYMPGCIAGGLVLGIVENIASMILPSVYKDVVAFVLLVAFLLFRPQGLLGKKNK